MHAISQEPVPCIYAQLETACSASSEDDESNDMYPEIRLIPADCDKCELSPVVAKLQARKVAELGTILAGISM